MKLPEISKNTTLFLAAVVIVLLGIMAYKTYRDRYAVTAPHKQELVEQQELMMINEQSDSDGVAEIEKDLIDTDFENLDKELMDIEKELSV